MTVFTVLELEFLASLRRHWATLYANELSRLLREFDEPYLIHPRMPKWRPRPTVVDRPERRH